MAAKQPRELDQGGYTAGVVVRAGQWPGRVVVRPDNDSLGCFGAESRNYIPIRFTLNSITLLGDNRRRLTELVFNVRGNLIQILDVTFIARRQLYGEFVNV